MKIERPSAVAVAATLCKRTDTSPFHAIFTEVVSERSDSNNMIAEAGCFIRCVRIVVGIGELWNDFQQLRLNHLRKECCTLIKELQEK